MLLSYSMRLKGQIIPPRWRRYIPPSAADTRRNKTRKKLVLQKSFIVGYLCKNERERQTLDDFRVCIDCFTVFPFVSLTLSTLETDP